jgi:hypothetical protein
MNSLEHFDQMIERERAARLKAGKSPVLDSDTIRLLGECARRKADSEREVTPRLSRGFYIGVNSNGMIR